MLSAGGPPLTSIPRLILVICAAAPAAAAAARVTAAYAQAPPVRPLVILVAGFAGLAGLFAWAEAVTPWGPILAASLALGWALACLAVIDLTVFRLPDALTLPLAVGGLAMAAVLPGRPLADHLAGAAAGWGGLTLLAIGYRRWRGRDGIGAGDAKLLAAAGAWLGWAALPSVILIACAATFAWLAVAALLRGPGVLAGRLAFGAPLCLATWIVWLHGPLAV